MSAEAHPKKARSGAALAPDDPLAAGDGLEPPTLRAGLLAGIGLGSIVFILVAMALLYGLYTQLLSNPGREPAHAFPEPRLETSINPRDMASTPEPGPAPRTLRHPPVEPAADMAAAMQAVAAKGAHAFDPVASGPVSGGGNVAQ